MFVRRKMRANIYFSFAWARPIWHCTRLNKYARINSPFPEVHPHNSPSGVNEGERVTFNADCFREARKSLINGAVRWGWLFCDNCRHRRTVQIVICSFFLTMSRERRHNMISKTQYLCSRKNNKPNRIKCKNAIVDMFRNNRLRLKIKTKLNSTRR